MKIYLMDPKNVHFSRNIEYIPYAHPVYTYSGNQLYILLEAYVSYLTAIYV